MKAYLSYLRIVSTFSVIFLHVLAFYVLHFEKYNINIWKTAHFFDSLVRFCVPVFLMISAALLLDKDEKLNVFLQKRLKRILLPFLFFSTVYFIDLHWKSFSGTDFLEILKNFYFGLMHGVSFHFWYIYLILGLYLFIPVLRKWTVSATNRKLLFFLVIWVFTLFGDFAASEYFPRIEVMYFSNYIGYLILGLYLSRLPVKSIIKVRFISLLMIVSGFLLIYFLTLSSTMENGKFIKNFYEYLSPNVALYSAGVFLFFKTFSFRTNRKCMFIDRNTFGIYLIHILVLRKLRVYASDSFFLHNEGWFVLYIILLSGLVFLASLLSIFILSKVPFLKNNGWIT